MAYIRDFIYLLLLALLSSWLILRGLRTNRYREGLGEKIWGRAPRRISTRPCLWLHGVSVGEVLLLRPLVAEIARKHADWDVVISTTTTTGLQVARSTFPDHMTFYAPLDFSWAVRSAVGRIKPTVLGLVELEVWPNLVAAAKHAGARVAIVNGRLSTNSAKGYGRLRWCLESTFREIDQVLAQTQEYADRFQSIGFRSEAVIVTGSMKYDGLEMNRGNLKTQRLRSELGIRSTDLVFVAGSTMEGEEAAAYLAYRKAREFFPNLRFVVVPRHPHRSDEVAQWLSGCGERVKRRTEVANSLDRNLEESPVWLIDTVGELSAIWGLADVAFVGGSLFPGRGGQNMMEPAAFGASVIFGPYTQNFRHPVEILKLAKAAHIVRTPDELTERLIGDIQDPESASIRGEAARNLIADQQGATQRTLDELERLMRGGQRNQAITRSHVRRPSRGLIALGDSNPPRIKPGLPGSGA